MATARSNCSPALHKGRTSCECRRRFLTLNESAALTFQGCKRWTIWQFFRPPCEFFHASKLPTKLAFYRKGSLTGPPFGKSFVNCIVSGFVAHPPPLPEPQVRLWRRPQVRAAWFRNKSCDDGNFSVLARHRHLMELTETPQSGSHPPNCAAHRGIRRLRLLAVNCVDQRPQVHLNETNLQCPRKHPETGAGYRWPCP